MSKPIFKINILNNENIKKIIVFYGLGIDNNTNLSIKKINEEFIKNPKNILFASIFNNNELKYIKNNSIDVIFIDEVIYIDDNISTIKIKIFQALSKTVSIEELYLFCLKMEKFTNIEVYKVLTQNNKMEISKNTLEQFLTNIIKNENGESITFKITNKEKYNYDDIISLNLNDKYFQISKPIGVKLFLIDDNYPFTVNPFYLNEENMNLLNNITKKSLSSLNSNLLLNTGDIINNNIYLCLANDVLTKFTYINKQNQQEQSMDATLLSVGEKELNTENIQLNIIQLYFPFLYKKNIKSLNDLLINQQKLIENTNQLITKGLLINFKNINMFYEIFNEKTTELNYINKGIKYIKFVLHPVIEIKYPLDTIFKIVSSNINNPLIKYNPSTRRENIYRLYTDGIMKDGRKIPYLSKQNITKLIKNIGKSKSIAFYIKNPINDYEIICEIVENGDIIISADFQDKTIDINDITSIIKENINPILIQIKDFFSQSGYFINMFENFFDKTIEIQNIIYETNILVNNNFNINDFQGCIKSIFNIETIKNNSIYLRFKRVRNYNKKNSIESFIIEKQKQNISHEEIINEILNNFDDITKNEANDLLIKIINENQLEKTANKRIEIKINPGFKTIINFDKFKSILNINMMNIDDILYLKTIPIYIDSFIRITQNMPSKHYSKNEINKLCKSKINDDIFIEDIISLNDKKLKTNEIPTIIKDDIVYKKPLNENIFNLIYGEDERSMDERSMDERSMDERSIEYEDERSMDERSMEYEVEGEEERHFVSIEKGREVSSGGKSNSISSISIPSIPSSVSSIPSSVSSIPSSVSSYFVIPAKKETVKNAKNEEFDEKLNTFKNIDGMKLKSPYYFQKRMKERLPKLFTKENEINYSKTCPSNIKRQPVILNKKELEEIKKNYPNYFKNEDIIKYGTNENDAQYFICPQYWCLLTNTFISEEDAKSGKCGKIIPHDSDDKVPKGSYVYEFYGNQKEHGKIGEYIKHYPGFNKQQTKDGKCLPCCFKKWDTTILSNKKEECTKNILQDHIINEKQEIPVKIIKEKKDDENYIKGSEKFPLEQNRWGYLPITIQKFFHEMSIDCQISNINTNIKLNHTCLLRHGIEKNVYQSFIACIADASHYPNKEVPTIKEMKNLIINMLTIDIFIKLQNGNLILDFYTSFNDIKEKNYDLYKKSNYYLKLNKEDENQIKHFEKIVSSYENFIQFLNDDDILIDYTYLWDFVCMDKMIFQNGINLVILEITDVDSNVQLVCPTNHTLNSFYEIRKPILFLIKRNDLYEPIYSYKNQPNKIVVSTTFSEYNNFLSPSFREIIKKIIKPTLNKMCIPLKSMPEIYKYQNAIYINELIIELNLIKCKIIKQIINFSNNKVIGILCKKNKITGFIPCYPSSLLSEYDYGFITDNNIWNNYVETFDFLTKIYEESKKKIPCKPVFKVLEDTFIIGIITISNQFVEIKFPVLLDEIKDDLKIIESSNYNKVDTEITSYNALDYDKERVEYIQKINLETKLYYAFRNTIRLLINKYENIEIRKNIENLINQKYITYNLKLKNMVDYIKKLSLDNILFIENFNYQLINEVSTCINKNDNDSKEQCLNNNLLCKFSNKNCQILLPKKNLINDNNNEIFYFFKISDEIIRYNRVRSFILQPQNYFSIEQIQYKINDNEIIILQSLLTPDFFDNLINYEVNHYVKQNDYDNAQPLKTQFYTNKKNTNDIFETMFQEKIIMNDATLLSVGEKKENVICNPEIINIKTPFLKKCFDTTKYGLINYNKNINCSFLLIIDIVKKIKLIDINILEIKKILYNKYTLYIKKYETKLYDILMLQGKTVLTEQLKIKRISLETFIFNENYYITNLDLQIVLEYYKIPTVLLSNKLLLETNYNSHFLIINDDEINLTNYENITLINYIFIVSTPPIIENVPNYKLLVSKNDINHIQFNLRNFNEFIKLNILENYKENNINVKLFISNYKK
jgi:hypothetical protein